MTGHINNNFTYQMNHVLLLSPDWVAQVVLDRGIFKVGDEIHEALYKLETRVTDFGKCIYLPFSTL